METEASVMLVAIRAKNESGGFFIAFVPAELDAAQICRACNELAIEAEEMLPLANWRTSTQNVAVSFVPFPQPSLWTAIQEPSLS